jgi:hypothetical protein
VVPPLYCSTAISSGGGAGTGRALGDGRRHRPRDGNRQKILEASHDKGAQLPLALEAGDFRIELRQVEGHHHLDLGIPELMAELARGIERAEVHHATAGEEHAEEGDEIVRRIREMEADGDAGTDAERAQPLGGPPRQRQPLRIGDVPVIEIAGDPVGPPLARALQEALHRHGWRQRLGPAHALGIEFFPDLSVHALLPPGARAHRRAETTRSPRPADSTAPLSAASL